MGIKIKFHLYIIEMLKEIKIIVVKNRKYIQTSVIRFIKTNIFELTFEVLVF